MELEFNKLSKRLMASQSCYMEKGALHLMGLSIGVTRELNVVWLSIQEVPYGQLIVPEDATDSEIALMLWGYINGKT